MKTILFLSIICGSPASHGWSCTVYPARCEALSPEGNPLVILHRSHLVYHPNHKEIIKVRCK